MERKVLGKGLEALIPQRSDAAVDRVADKEFVYLPLYKIKPSRYQPRENIDQKELESLANSIQEKGFLQPIIVRKVGEDYEIVAGSRRYMAAELLGKKEVPVLIKTLDNKDTFVVAIIENLQRKDLNPIDEALAFKRLMEEFHFTLESIGRYVGKDKSSVANTLRLLKLPPQIQDAVRKTIISRSQARTLLALETDKERILLFQKMLTQGFSVRDLEHAVRVRSKKVKKKDLFVADLEEKFQKRLGTRVKIFNRKNNSGRIVIEYFNLNDLSRIEKKLL